MAPILKACQTWPRCVFELIETRKYGDRKSRGSSTTCCSEMSVATLALAVFKGRSRSANLHRLGDLADREGYILSCGLTYGQHYSTLHESLESRVTHFQV